MSAKRRKSTRADLLVGLKPEKTNSSERTRLFFRIFQQRLESPFLKLKKYLSKTAEFADNSEKYLLSNKFIN
jgi:hypothetical protein